MKYKLLALFVCLFAGFSSALAGDPFRDHRYDTFKVLGTSTDGDIIFIGNSITNYHEWWEAFDNAKIKNRGVSGAVSDEVVANLGSLVGGQPEKVFLMIGTNDLGKSGINNAAHVATNVRIIVKFIQGVSPDTEIYVQSILPSTSGTRTLELEQETNAALRDICTETGATYIDLWDLLLPIATNSNDYSLDGLHCSAPAYRTWCKAIAKYVGSASTYPDDATVNYSGLSDAYGMSTSTFAMLPVKDGDILIIGDGMVHSGEWHELLGSSNKVKARGTGWGYGGLNIANITKQIPAILNGRDDNGEPAKVFLYAGTADANGSDAVSAIKTRYQTLVNTVRKYAPNAEIYIQALLPNSNATKNTSRIVPVNEALQEIATANDNTFYVDDYTPFVADGVANTAYFSGNYVQGKGYAKLAGLLAAYMGDDVTPMSEEAAAALYDRLTTRNVVAAAIATAYACPEGNGVGQYPAESLTPLRGKLNDAYAALADTGTPLEELTALATSLNETANDVFEAINQPTASTDGDEHWYQLYTPQRDNLYLTSNGVGSNVTGEQNGNNANSMWKFVARTDGTFDIINRDDNSYLSPNSSYGTNIKTSADAPDAGWTLSYSNAPGTYIITSETVQLNQTDATHSHVLFNWSSGSDGRDRDDLGCRYAIAEAGDLPEEPVLSTNILVNTSTGTLYRSNGTANQSWNKTWVSNNTLPELTLDASVNNMTSTNGNIVGYVGSQTTSCTYTLSVPEGYIITGWSMDIAQHQGTTAITLTAGGSTYTTSSEDQNVTVSGLNARTATFTLSGANTDGVVFKNFSVTVAESEEEPEPRAELFITNTTDQTIANRIPAIATAHNGNLLALADYRYSGADIGGSSANDGKIDLRYRISTDNGQTWGDIKTLAAAKGYAYGNSTGDSLNAAFGDPCIVADRESDRVLVLSCSGMVSFQNGTRTNHQGIARFYSEDNGGTWSEATNIAESIYSQFDKRTDGPVRSMFVGSGKIAQSQIIKVGEYYRLYCALLVTLNGGSYANFVLYSDDFGGEWKVLGGVQNAPVGSSGNEPKAEELPDGSVIISSRATGGRYFNIYTYTDRETGEGYWNSQAFSGSSNNGTTANSNSTNGEILFVPVVRKADSKKMYLALQSVPFGPNRANVGIYYKGIESPEGYASPETFAANWEGSHQASDTGSAYSTMTWQQDNTLGFLYEESTYNSAYTIVYKNYTLEYLTDDTYEYDDDPDREAFAFSATALDARMEEVRGMVGTAVGNLTEAGLDKVEKAYDAYVSAPTAETYEAFAVAFAGTEKDVVTINPKLKYRLRNSNRQDGTLYLVSTTTALTAATLDVDDDSQLFTFIPTDENDTYIVSNEASAVFIGRTGNNEVKIPVVTAQKEASDYRIVSSRHGLSSLSCTNPVNNPAIHLAGDCVRLVPWNATSPASLWYIEPTEVATGIDSVSAGNAPTADAAIYDLSGRRVYTPGRGVYISAGRKFIKR